MGINVKDLQSFDPNKSKLSKWLDLLALPVYIFLMHFLFLFLFEKVYEANYEGKLFIYDFNLFKYLICIAETFILFFTVRKRFRRSSLSNTIMIYLDLLYFLPGFLFQAVTDVAWEYMLFYLCFYLMMNFWDSIIDLSSLRAIKLPQPGKWIDIFSITAFIVAISYGIVYGKVLTVNTFVNAFKNVYEVRANASSAHWAIETVKLWATYYACIMISYYITKKRWFMAALMVFTSIIMFVQQANRIFMFFLICSIAIGFIKLDNRKLKYLALALIFLIAIESFVTSTGFVCDVFRRYGIVPNRLSEQYFDFFAFHRPDYLRTTFPRILRLFGISSPYETNPYSKLIGITYYGRDMNANTGLIGGGLASLGSLSIIITPFAYIMAFKLYEYVTKGAKNSAMTQSMSVILASLAINAPTMLANMVRPSYYALLFLTLLPFSGMNGEHEKKKKRRRESVLYITYVDMNGGASGSGIRPLKMLHALKGLGYNIKVLSGNQSIENRENRLNDIQALKEWLHYNTPLFCYIESSTYPIMFHDDRALFSLLKSRKVPIGYFYRDFYRKFPELFPRRKGFINTLKEKYLDFLQWRTDVAVSNADIVYVPSEKAGELLDNFYTVPLPPAGEDRIENRRAPSSTCIYIGGITNHYGGKMLLDAFEILNQNGNKYRLILVCRKQEWHSFKHPAKDAPWLEVHHTSGDGLEPLYAQASVALLAPKSDYAYNDLAVSVKLFEYMGHGLPVVSVNSASMDKIIQKYELGLSVPYDAQAFADAVAEICSNKEKYDRFCENTENAIRKENLWIHRAEQIRDELIDEGCEI